MARATRSAGRDAVRAAQASRNDGSKLASVVADMLVGDIAAAGWPVGEVFGSEADLLERYQVSRAVLREAVRLVEHLQVASMQRGTGGGLVVLPPTVDSVTDAVCVYLYYVGAEVDEVFDARIMLEELAAELAPIRLDETGVKALRRLVQDEEAGRARDHRELHRLVAEASGNPALAFFVELLNRVSLQYLMRAPRYPAQLDADSHRAHAAIVDAVVGGNAALARARMRKHLAAEADFLRARRSSRRRLATLPVVGRSDKRAEQTVRQILHEVAKAGWPVGRVLGSEAELMERYGISRAVLREAVRVLEHHQIARTRRGPGGGLVVTEPSAGAVTDAVALNVNRLGMQRSHLFELRVAVEMVVLELAMANTEEAEAPLRQALEAEERASPAEFASVGHDLHGVLASVAGNRVIELLVLVLLRLTRFRSATPEAAATDTPSEVRHVHARIVEAILEGDLDLARLRMRRHLDALQEWTR